jgi:hypothetical protein
VPVGDTVLVGRGDAFVIGRDGDTTACVPGGSDSRAPGGVMVSRPGPSLAPRDVLGRSGGATELSVSRNRHRIRETARSGMCGDGGMVSVSREAT